MASSFSEAFSCGNAIVHNLLARAQKSFFCGEMFLSTGTPWEGDPTRAVPLQFDISAMLQCFTEAVSLQTCVTIMVGNRLRRRGTASRTGSVSGGRCRSGFVADFAMPAAGLVVEVDALCCPDWRRLGTRWGHVKPRGLDAPRLRPASSRPHLRPDSTDADQRPLELVAERGAARTQRSVRQGQTGLF